jgi:hypothetical protein
MIPLFFDIKQNKIFCVEFEIGGGIFLLLLSMFNYCVKAISDNALCEPWTYINSVS